MSRKGEVLLAEQVILQSLRDLRFRTHRDDALQFLTGDHPDTVAVRRHWLAQAGRGEHIEMRLKAITPKVTKKILTRRCAGKLKPRVFLARLSREIDQQEAVAQ